MTNWDKFIEAVKSGKIEGLSDACSDGLYIGKLWCMTPLDEWESDHLCAHIRRWLSGKGWEWTHGKSWLCVFTTEDSNSRATYTEGSELDWHIDAALWVLEKEGQQND